jgi:hypothetical protein
MDKDYSIHYHVWTQTELPELMLKNMGEVIFILRKAAHV